MGNNELLIVWIRKLIVELILRKFFIYRWDAIDRWWESLIRLDILLENLLVILLPPVHAKRQISIIEFPWSQFTVTFGDLELGVVREERLKVFFIPPQIENFFFFPFEPGLLHQIVVFTNDIDQLFRRPIFRLLVDQTCDGNGGATDFPLLDVIFWFGFISFSQVLINFLQA